MSQCRSCGADIVFGRTSNGKAMPLDPAKYPDDDVSANLAIYKDHTGRINVRVLKAGQEPEPFEHRGMPHFATCEKLKADGAARRGDLRSEGVIPFPKQRRR
jgi:hypothetical protein